MKREHAQPKRVVVGYAGAALGGALIGAIWPLFDSPVIGYAVAAVFLVVLIVLTLPWIHGLPPVWRWSRLSRSQDRQ